MRSKMKSSIFLSGNGCSKVSKVVVKPCRKLVVCFQPWGTMKGTRFQALVSRNITELLLVLP